MSEMKPCGWAARSQSGAFLTLAAERHQVECHPQLYRSDEIIPLYDGNTVATAIAEAVAAERERCAKLVKAEIKAFVGDRRQFIKKAEAREILKSLRQDIRSAAK